jgi:iron complex transport system ATP-binding protein
VSGAPLVEARGLRFGYEAGAEVLSGVDLTLAAGEVLFVLGPNGCGKTTLVHLLCGCLEPAGGEVLLGGQDARRLDARGCATAVAVVPQELDGVGTVPVERFVLGGRFAHVPRWRSPSAHDRARCDEALERAQAGGFRGRLLGQLSAGQRQRVHLARALAQEAPALLLDEPTSALDPGHQVEVLDLARAQARAGAGVLVVTHDLNLTSQYATRVLLLAGGRAAAEGPPAEVLRPEVLRPVYGERLWFGTFPDSGLPIVLPRGGD